MKTKIFFTAAVATALLMSTSCKNEVEDIFDDSAANRIENALVEYSDVLTSAPNGWVMQYFANDEEPGASFVMKFSTDGSVNVASANFTNGYKLEQETSLFEMIADNGPVLTFNTYNNVFHVFSDPGIDPSAVGIGHGGDYEFMVMKAQADTVILRGKKTSIKALLLPLKDGETAQQYFDNLIAHRDAMFNSKFNTLTLHSEGQNYELSDCSSGLISVVPEGGDAVTDTKYYPYVLTEKGFRFISAWEGYGPGNTEGQSFSEFAFDESGKLLCLDDKASYISCAALSSLISDKSLKWNIDPDTMTGSISAVYDAVVSGCKQAYPKLEFKFFRINYNTTAKKYSLYFENGSAKGNFYCNIIAQDDNTVRFEFDGTTDSNAKSHLNKVPDFQNFINILASSSFTLSSVSSTAPTTISIAGGDSKFNVNVQ
ncbi:MAG: DUF4302 domain-containing protein [Muribaculaceae bacterium]